MTTFTLFRLFTINENSVRSYVTWIIYNPIIFSSKSHSIWPNSALKSKSVFTTIKLKTQSVLFCNFNFRCTINSNTNFLSSFFAHKTSTRLCPFFNQPLFHDISNYLAHLFLITYSNAMISNIPFSRIIIH